MGRVQECVHYIKKNTDTLFFNFRFNIIINFKLKKKEVAKLGCFCHFILFVITQFLTIFILIIIIIILFTEKDKK